MASYNHFDDISGVFVDPVSELKGRPDFGDTAGVT